MQRMDKTKKQTKKQPGKIAKKNRAEATAEATATAGAWPGACRHPEAAGIDIGSREIVAAVAPGRAARTVRTHSASLRAGSSTPLLPACRPCATGCWSAG